MATSISHIWRKQEIIAKSIHHVINITSIKAKLFAMRCGINCATQLQDIAHNIVITDAIPATKQIFDTSIHPHQITLESFLIKTLIIQFQNEIVLAVSSSLHTYWLIKSQNALMLILCFQANLHRSLAEKKKATLFFANGRCISKLWSTKEEISST